MNTDLPILTSIKSRGGSFINPRIVKLESIYAYWIWSHLDIPNLQKVTLRDSFKKVIRPYIHSLWIIFDSCLDVPELIYPYFIHTDDEKSIDYFVKSIDIPNSKCRDSYFSSFDLSLFVLLESIQIGENNFTSVQAFKIDGLQLLKKLIVKNNSFACKTNNTNQEDQRSFHISNCASLLIIEIGNDCFRSVKTFKIDKLNSLRTIKIGNNSFTQRKNSAQAGYQTKSLHILNCASLESIQIGEYSFSDYAGEFELKNLPKLQSIQIGTIKNESNNFYCGSFVIQGIYDILNIPVFRSS